jgi:hypothetical protein
VLFFPERLPAGRLAARQRGNLAHPHRPFNHLDFYSFTDSLPNCQRDIFHFFAVIIPQFLIPWWLAVLLSLNLRVPHSSLFEGCGFLFSLTYL